MVFIPPAQMRRLPDPGIHHEWDVALAHGATPGHRPVVDLTLPYDTFGIRTHWDHTPNGLEWAASAVRLPDTGWTHTRLSQAVRLASQQPRRTTWCGTSSGACSTCGRTAEEEIRTAR